MKVFGIGLNKTGTKTLGSCFARFGMRHLSGRPDLLAKYRAGAVLDVFAEIDRYESFEDWPYPLMFRELFFRYGHDAKFVLTLRRSPEVWLNSLKRHSLRTSPDNHSRLLAYGYAYPHGVEACHLDQYEQHAANVRQFFRAHAAQDRLLEVCWESGDEWAPLCTFLRRPVPSDPFPHKNKSPEQAPSPQIVALNLELIRRQLHLLGQYRDIDQLRKEALGP